jgi:hypothetical protein
MAGGIQIVVHRHLRIHILRPPVWTPSVNINPNATKTVTTAAKGSAGTKSRKAPTLPRSRTARRTDKTAPVRLRFMITNTFYERPRGECSAAGIGPGGKTFQLPPESKRYRHEVRVVIPNEHPVVTSFPEELHVPPRTKGDAHACVDSGLGHRVRRQHFIHAND